MHQSFIESEHWRILETEVLPALFEQFGNNLNMERSMFHRMNPILCYADPNSYP